MLKYLKSLSLLVVFGVIISAVNVSADITPEAKENLKTELQRTPTGASDLQQNTVSNLQFYTTNYGIFGLNTAALSNQGGGYWPRGSVNQYIFGGGIWFGCRKTLTDTSSTPRSLCSITYNPNSGKGWYVPGRIYEEGPQPDKLAAYNMDADLNDVDSYRLYFSTDYNRASGEALDGLERTPNWPIWDDGGKEDTLKVDRYFGHYIEEKSRRNRETYSKGPAFISGEDIFATYKDTDLSRYEDGPAKARAAGYPLYLQYEQWIYSWGFGDYRDFIFLRYDITNYSPDTLRDCYLAPVLDVDLGRAPYTSYGAANDRTRFYKEDSTLNLAVQWTNTDRGELGYGFGYLGFDFLESPAVVTYYDSIEVTRPDSTTYIKVVKNNDNWTEESGLPMPNTIRKDKKWYTNEEQLGLVTMNNWNIADDKIQHADRYNYLARGVLDEDNGPGDKRFMMATGPFHVLPKDTFRTVVAIVLANTAGGEEATGEEDDLAELVRKDIFAQEVYDNNFRAPLPPDPTLFTPTEGGNNGALGLNHAVTITWDSSSVWTNDKNERGLDFMGYKLYRARRSNLDTFATNDIDAGVDGYSKGRGPLGWKEIRRWQIPTPFFKSPFKSGSITDKDYANMPYIDDYIILGPAVKNNRIVDSMAIRVMRKPKGLYISTYSEKDSITINANDTTRIWNDLDNDGKADLKYSQRKYHGNHIFPYVVFADSTNLLRGYPWATFFTNKVTEGSDQYGDRNTVHYMDFGSDAGPDVAIKNVSTDPIWDYLVGDYVLSPNLKTAGYNPLYFKRLIANVNVDWVYSLKDTTYFSNYIVGDTIHKHTKDDEGKVLTTDVIRTTIDTIYYPETARMSTDSPTGWVMDIEVPYEVDNYYDLMKDSTHIKKVRAMLYYAIQNNYIKSKETTLMDFEGTDECREIMESYFDRITNGRRFTDFGDDNRDGYVNYLEDPIDTEKLINNVNYYYKIVAYDEGDFTQPTPKKENTPSEPTPEAGKSAITAVPRAAEVGYKTELEIISQTDDKLGSLNNFKFHALDMQRVQKLFGGDTMKLTFNPYWAVSRLLLPGAEEGQEPFEFGLYRSILTLENENTGDTLYQGLYQYELENCNYGWTDLYSENAASVVYKTPEGDGLDTIRNSYGTPIRVDTIRFHKRSNTDWRQRNGSFNSGDFRTRGYCYARNWADNFKNMMEFDFDFSMRQYGGVIRPDSASIYDAKRDNPDVWTPVVLLDGYIKTASVSFENKDEIKSTQYASWDYNNASNIACGFNNGPGIYKVTFKEGGTEDISMAYNASKNFPGTNIIEGTVDYLLMDVENVYSYNRSSLDGDSVEVSYPGKMEPIALPMAKIIDMKNFYQYQYTIAKKDQERLNPFPETRLYPDPRNLGQVDTNSSLNLSTNQFIGKYNLAAYAYYNRRGTKGFNAKKKMTLAVTTDTYDDNTYHGLSLYDIVADRAPSFTVGANDKNNAYSGLPQNRYYKSTQIDGKWLDFTHELQINGVSFALDYANAGAFGNRTVTGIPELLKYKEYYDKPKEDPTAMPLGRDFKAGDVIYLKVTGGASGFPLPGANVRFVVNTNEDNVKYTEDILDDIKIVPNPYYISHQGQASPYDAKIYFTKLPAKCTVSIYTSSGQLIRELENNQPVRSNNGVVEWDLLNQNGQRAQSQPLIAVIETPDGTTSIQNFAIVVGGFKTITE